MNSKFREVPRLCSFKKLKVRATVHNFAVSSHKDSLYTYSELNRGRGRCHRSLALHSIDDPLFVSGLLKEPRWVWHRCEQISLSPLDLIQER